MERHPAQEIRSVFGGGHFTGRVWLDQLLDKGGDVDGVRMYRVFFEPAARTHWHAHPGGQSLFILAGKARVGAQDQATIEAGPGDVVYTPPGEWHWHGAAPDGYMIHIAHNPGAKTDWGDDRAVTDEEYEV